MRNGFNVAEELLPRLAGRLQEELEKIEEPISGRQEIVIRHAIHSGIIEGWYECVREVEGTYKIKV